MSRLSSCAFTLACFGAWMASSVVDLAAQANAPRGVVLILADDLGWKDLACTGSRFYETPNLDRLRAEGMLFPNAYANAAICSPTRAAFLTGRLPARIGITDWIHHASTDAALEASEGKHLAGFAKPPEDRLLETPKNRTFLPLDAITIAELLAPRAYTSAYIGKWHLGGTGWLPTDQGFAQNIGGFAFGQPPSYFDPYANMRWPAGIPTLPPRKKGEYLTAREADEAVLFLQKVSPDQKFFLLYAPHAVHSPIQAPKPTIARYREKLAARDSTNDDAQNYPAYAAMIDELDAGVGRIFDQLRAMNAHDDTLVVFTSDNGGVTHFRGTSNLPLRKGKGFPYEGGLRVPLLARLPGIVRAGSTCTARVWSTDILPTVTEICGARLPADLEIDGLSLVPLFGDPNVEPPSFAQREMTWHFPHYWWGGRVTPWSVLRSGDTKLVHWYETGTSELYDLRQDPGETDDLAPREAERLAAMQAALFRALAAQGAQLPRRTGK